MRFSFPRGLWEVRSLRSRTYHFFRFLDRSNRTGQFHVRSTTGRYDARRSWCMGWRERECKDNGLMTKTMTSIDHLQAQDNDWKRNKEKRSKSEGNLRNDTLITMLSMISKERLPHCVYNQSDTKHWGHAYISWTMINFAFSLSVCLCSRRHHFNCSFFSLFSLCSLTPPFNFRFFIAYISIKISFIRSSGQSNMFTRSLSLSVSLFWYRRMRENNEEEDQIEKHLLMERMINWWVDPAMFRWNFLHMSLDNEEQLFVQQSVCLLTGAREERKLTLPSTAQALQWFIT